MADINIVLDVIIIIFLILPIFVIYKSKKRLLVTIWFILSYIWTFISYSRIVNVESGFYITTLGIIVTHRKGYKGKI